MVDRGSGFDSQMGQRYFCCLYRLCGPPSLYRKGIQQGSMNSQRRPDVLIAFGSLRVVSSLLVRQI